MEAELDGAAEDAGRMALWDQIQVASGLGGLGDGDATLVVLVHGGNGRGKYGGLGGPGCREGRHSDGGSGDEPEPHGLAH